MKKGAVYLGVLLGFLVFYCSFAAVFFGQSAYAADDTSDSEAVAIAHAKPNVSIISVDGKGAPVEGAQMELWRLPYPVDFNEGTPEYKDADEVLGDNARYLVSSYKGKVDSWTTDGTGRHVVDLQEYFPDLYSEQYDDFSDFKKAQLNFYMNDGEPYYYMLIEKKSPTGYMTARKTFFRISIARDRVWDPGKKKYDVFVKYYMHTFKYDPRSSEDYTYTRLAGNYHLEPNISNSGFLYNNNLEAKHIYAPLLIEKVDQDGDAIKGAKLTLYDAAGNRVDEWISGTEAHKITNADRPTFPDSEANPVLGGVNVGPQIYTLKETETPEGYERAEDVRFKLYPCGKWDYMDGSEPSVPHASMGDPSEKNKSTCDGSSALGSPCREEISEPDPSTLNIKYSYIDPVRIVNRQAEKSSVEGDSSEGFVINKIDQYREPIPDVEFEVYAKPVLSYETEVSVKKEWEYEGASTVTGQIGPDNHAIKPESFIGDEHETANVGDVAFPYSLISGLQAEVRVINGDEKQTFTGSTLESLLGDSMTNAVRESGKENVEINGKQTDTADYWHYQGEAQEDLGTFTIREGETVTIRETFAGSLAGQNISLMYNGMGYNSDTEKWEEMPMSIKSDLVYTGGFGTYNIFGRAEYNEMPYAKAIAPEDLTFFPRRDKYGSLSPFRQVFGEDYLNSNLVRHIAPGLITITFKDGKLIRTDAEGNEQEIEDKAVVLKNIVQWRGEGDGEVRCPPKWK